MPTVCSHLRLSICSLSLLDRGGGDTALVAMFDPDGQLPLLRPCRLRIARVHSPDHISDDKTAAEPVDKGEGNTGEKRQHVSHDIGSVVWHEFFTHFSTSRFA